MKVIATRQIHGVYGTKLAGEEFDVVDSIGAKLVARKLVKPVDTYAIKAIQPSINQPHIEHGDPRPTNKKR